MPSGDILKAVVVSGEEEMGRAATIDRCVKCQVERYTGKKNKAGQRGTRFLLGGQGRGLWRPGL